MGGNLATGRWDSSSLQQPQRAAGCCDGGKHSAPRNETMSPVQKVAERLGKTCREGSKAYSPHVSLIKLVTGAHMIPMTRLVNKHNFKQLGIFPSQS